MFRFLNKIISDNPLKRALKNSRGQAAVVLILLIAAMLIFYAVSLNFGKLSAVKTAATSTSDTSASLLGSGMASYAQSLSMGSLQGKLKKCGFTGVFSAILGVLIIVVVIATGGGASPLLVIGLSLAVGGVILQAAVINPGITNAWNNIISETLSRRNQLTENALQAGLGKIVTDQVQVPDVTDADQDRVWENDINSRPFSDVTSRFAAYYSRRLQNVGAGPVKEVDNFITAVDIFLNGNPAVPLADRWALHDHLDPTKCVGRAECHPCCVPEEFDGEKIRPAFCDVNSNGEWRRACRDASTYGGQYRWEYDNAYEEPKNAFFSFRELIGKDDEHQRFYKDNANTPPIFWNPNRIPQNEHRNRDRGFYLEDTSGYYTEGAAGGRFGGPPYPDLPEYRKGIYPWFYKMSQWGVDLSKLNVASRPRECHWCDERWPGSPCVPCREANEGGPPTGPHPHPGGPGTGGIPQLRLPHDPADLEVPTSYFVDADTDIVPLPEYIFAKPNVCAQDTLYPISTEEGFWKPGADRFCSTQWPYYADCPKHEGKERLCSDVSLSRRDRFPDDAIDDLLYGLGDFVNWAETLIQFGQENFQKLSLELDKWYPEAARWIEPAQGEGPCFMCTLPPAERLQNPPEGFLRVYFKELSAMNLLLGRWKRSPDEAGYVGSTCSEAWCVPPESPPADCGEPRGDEGQTFDYYGTRIYGDLPSVIECLRFNWEGPIDNGPVPEGEAPNVVGPGGNDARFQACYDACNACLGDVAACDNIYTYNGDDFDVNDLCGATTQPPAYLPRTLIPAFDPRDSRPPSGGSPSRPGPVEIASLTDFTNCPSICDPCTKSCEDPKCFDDCLKDKNKCIDKSTKEWEKCGNKCVPLADPVPCLAACVNERFKRDAQCATDESTCKSDCTKVENTCKDKCECTIAGPQYKENRGLPKDVPIVLKCGSDIDPPAPVINVLKGICETKDPSSFLNFVQRSIPLAENQVAKFEKRWDFLNERNRWLNYILEQVIGPGLEQFRDFVNSPAVLDFIRARKNFDPNNIGLPNHAIYGWRDQAPEDGSAPRGHWHIVKVEARVPEDCDNACASNQVSADPEWPKIKTETKAWGTRRCYELINTEGSVKFRTTRYDEEGAPDALTFPNKVPLWRFRSGHPDRPQDGSFDPEPLDTLCASSEITQLPDGTPTTIYDGAFMMEKRNGSNGACWDLAHRLLSRGVVSETCAVYFWDKHKDDDKERMNFKFVPCREF